MIAIAPMEPAFSVVQCPLSGSGRPVPMLVAGEAMICEASPLSPIRSPPPGWKKSKTESNDRSTALVIGCIVFIFR